MATKQRNEEEKKGYNITVAPGVLALWGRYAVTVLILLCMIALPLAMATGLLGPSNMESKNQHVNLFWKIYFCVFFAVRGIAFLVLEIRLYKREQYLRAVYHITETTLTKEYPDGKVVTGRWDCLEKVAHCTTGFYQFYRFYFSDGPNIDYLSEKLVLNILAAREAVISASASDGQKIHEAYANILKELKQIQLKVVKPVVIIIASFSVWLLFTFLLVLQVFTFVDNEPFHVLGLEMTPVTQILGVFVISLAAVWYPVRRVGVLLHCCTEISDKRKQVLPNTWSLVDQELIRVDK